MASLVSKEFIYHNTISECRKSHLEHGQSKRSSNSSVQDIPKKEVFQNGCTISLSTREERMIRNLNDTKRLDWRQINKAYMSITSLIRTLTATSIDGFPVLLVNWGDTVI